MSASMTAIQSAAPPVPLTNNSLNSTSTSVLVTTNAMIWTTPTGTGSAAASTPPLGLIVLAGSVAATFTIVGNLAALCWFGMWMGLNSKNTSLATLKTILFVQIVPWFVVSFASALVVPLLLFPSLIKGGTAPPSAFLIWFPLLTTMVATVLYLAKDVAFVAWARRKLYADFRTRAAQGLAPVRLNMPPKATLHTSTAEARTVASAEKLPPLLQ